MDDLLILIKLGGSLITYKDQPETARPDIIEASLKTILKLRNALPQLKIIVGHGSGSFGHTTAKRFSTMDGVSTPKDWLGFAEVAKSAKTLNDLVFDIGINLGLPLKIIRPSSQVLTTNRQIVHWNLSPIQSFLSNQEIPLIYGDVILDTQIGGTILSTEELFLHLAEFLKPSMMLIAGIEAGVYADYPVNSRVIPTISRDDALIGLNLAGSQTPDVTGGMLTKVRLLQLACRRNPGMGAYIYDGLNFENTIEIVSGSLVGTQIR